MPSEIEFRAAQKTALHELLIVKKANDKAGIKVKRLNALIETKKAAMLEEDIALIERMAQEADLD